MSGWLPSVVVSPKRPTLVNGRTKSAVSRWGFLRVKLPEKNKSSKMRMYACNKHRSQSEFPIPAKGRHVSDTGSLKLDFCLIFASSADIL
jgi:hypothetical protein